MRVKILVKDINWDVPEEYVGLEPLDEDEASIEDILRRRYVELPEKVKELYPELPKDVELELDLDEKDDLNEDGTIYGGVLACIVNYALLDEYGYGAVAMGDFIILEGDLRIDYEE